MARNTRRTDDQPQTEDQAPVEGVGQPRQAGITDEQRAALKASQEEARIKKAEEAELKKAERAAERAAAKEAKTKQREQEKTDAIAAKEAHRLEVEAATAEYKKAVDAAQSEVEGATALLDAAKEILKTARAEYRAAGGRIAGVGDEGGTVNRKYTVDYVSHDVATKGGRKSINNNDALAIALMGKDSDATFDVLRANGLEPGVWDHLNEGMKKMNAGNKLRALIKKGTPVTVDGIQVTAL